MSKPYALAGDIFTTVEPGYTGNGAYIMRNGSSAYPPVALYLSDRELDDLAAWIDGHLQRQRAEQLDLAFPL